MLIPPDSPLRRLPADVDPRLAAVLDGVRYSIEMVEISYLRLRMILTDIHTRFAASETVPEAESGQPPIRSHLFVAAFADAWTIIDAGERLRNLLPLLPKHRQNPSFRDFDANSSTIKDLRNCIQHLEGEIGNLVAAKMSTWGELDWYLIPKPGADHGWINIIGSMSMRRALIHERKHPFNPVPIGAPFVGPVDWISLTAHGHRISLTELANRVGSVAVSLAQSLENRSDLLPTPDMDFLLQLSLSLSSVDPRPAGGAGGGAAAVSIVAVDRDEKPQR